MTCLHIPTIIYDKHGVKSKNHSLKIIQSQSINALQLYRTNSGFASIIWLEAHEDKHIECSGNSPKGGWLWILIIEEHPTYVLRKERGSKRSTKITSQPRHQ